MNTYNIRPWTCNKIQENEKQVRITNYAGVECLIAGLAASYILFVLLLITNALFFCFIFIVQGVKRPNSTSNRDIHGVMAHPLPPPLVSLDHLGMLPPLMCTRLVQPTNKLILVVDYSSASILLADAPHGPKCLKEDSGSHLH